MTWKILKKNYDELINVYKNQPVEPGDTISHQGAKELHQCGYIDRPNTSRWLITVRGMFAYHFHPVMIYMRLKCWHRGW